MNLQGSNRLRMLLLGAVAAGAIGPQLLVAGPLPVVSNTKKPAVKPGMAKPAAVTPPRLLPMTEADTAVIQPVAQTQAAPSSNKKSEVMRQLELLYQQDGREMPELNTDIRPVPTGGTPAAPGAANAPAPQAAPATANGLRTHQPAPVQQQAQPVPTPASATPAPKAKNPVVSFFKKLVPGGSKDDPKPTAAPKEYRPDVAPLPPGGIASRPPAKLQPDIAATMDAKAIATLPPLDAEPRTPFAPAAGVALDLPEPLAIPGDIPPSPNSTASLPPLLAEPMGAPSVAENDAATETATAASNPANPFTEMTEAEADKKLELNPFTGLTLDEDAGSANPPKADAPLAAPAQDDPFAEELKKMGIVPPGTETPKLAAPSAPTTDTPTFDGIEDQATRDKMKKIHERGSMKGLKGFCPVSLRDQRELVDAKPEFHSTFRGQKFHFANADAKLKFDEEPARFAPAAYGADVVALTRDKDVIEGSLDFAAWFKGRLYLFGTQEAHDTFVEDPSKYATPVGIE